MTTDYMWIYPHRTSPRRSTRSASLRPRPSSSTTCTSSINRRSCSASSRCAISCSQQPTDTIHTVMERDIVHVDTDTNAQDVAGTIARYDLLACPVLDENGVMLGIVTVDDAIDAIFPERLKRQLPRFTRNAQAPGTRRGSVGGRTSYESRVPLRVDVASYRLSWACSRSSGPASSRQAPTTTSAASQHTRKPARSLATRFSGRSFRSRSRSSSCKRWRPAWAPSPAKGSRG